VQQLTAQTYKDFLQQQNDIILVNTEVPATPLKAKQLVDALCHGSGFSQLAPDWGADRFQVMLVKQDIRCLLCIEWLCEAVWLEPTGTTDIQRLWQTLQAN